MLGNKGNESSTFTKKMGARAVSSKAGSAGSSPSSNELSPFAICHQVLNCQMKRGTIQLLLQPVKDKLPGKLLSWKSEVEGIACNLKLGAKVMRRGWDLGTTLVQFLTQSNSSSVAVNLPIFFAVHLTWMLEFQ